MSEPREHAVVARLTAVALVILAALQLRADVMAAMFTEAPRAALAIAQMTVGAIVLAGLAILTWPRRRRWMVAALVAVALGWLAHSAALEPLRHPLLDARLVQSITTLGALAIGAALVRSIDEPRIRHSAVVLLAGFAVFGALTVLAEHRIGHSLDFPTIVALRKERDFTDALADVALAGVLWLYGPSPTRMT